MALTSKRLCERWLDNMFMILYEVKIQKKKKKKKNINIYIYICHIYFSYEN